MDGSLEAFRVNLECTSWTTDCKIYENMLSCEGLLLNSLTLYLPDYMSEV